MTAHRSGRSGRRRAGRLRTAGAVLALAGLVAACTSARATPAPTWTPKQSFDGDGGGLSIAPQLPTATTSPQPSGSGSGSSSAANQPDPTVLATNLTTPVGLTLLPDGTALVGERTTGRILRVQPQAGQPVTTVRTITGLDPAGDGGLLDLALSPNYAQDGLIFAYLSTATDNRVVDFTLTGPVTPVLVGIPHGATDNTGRLLFGADGDLYVGTGDAGSPALAADPTSLAGKVLRITDIGRPAPGNPSPTSPVYTSGQHVVNGLCEDVTTPQGVLEVEGRGAANAGQVDGLSAGASYGWPTVTAGSVKPLATLPPKDTSPGGCAVLDGAVYVTSLDGTALLAAQLSGAGASLKISSFSTFVAGTYGRLLTVVVGSTGGAPDGSLWMTTANKDGHGKPGPTDDRVIRIVPSGGNGAASSLPV